MAYGYVFSVNQLHSAHFALLSHLQPCVLATHKHIFSRVNFSLPTMCTAHYPFFSRVKDYPFANWSFKFVVVEYKSSASGLFNLEHIWRQMLFN